MSKYKILHKGAEFDASEYQDAVFEFIEKGAGNLVINAAAGSAKTTTMINCFRFIPEDKKIILMAFNKHIAEDANNSINSPNVMARTCSSVGYEICRENGIGTGEVNNEKYPDYIRQNICLISEYGETASLGRSYSTYMKNIRDLVDLCRYTLNFTIKEIEKLALKYGIVPIRDEISVVRKVLIWGESNTEVIDQTDMVWLPNVLNLTTKRLLKDYIFIDEAQDISIAQQALIMKCAKRGARIIAVGDRNQQINVWCGSDEAAIDKFREMPNTIELKLPVCYRCGKKIIDFANKYSSDTMIPAPNAIDGEVRKNVSLSEINIGDMVLSRNTAPLIELQQKLLRRNQKVYIQGFKEIKEDYLNLINSCNSEKIDKACLTSNGLFPQLYGTLLDEINRLINTLGMDEDEALARPSVLYLYDNIESLKVISEGLTTVQELIDKINLIFNESQEGSVLLSTVHRAKGLEADRVFIYKPSILENNRLATKDWEIKTERNLQYVAYTRPKKKLYFVEEEAEYWKKNPYASSINFKKEIEIIKNKINYSNNIGEKIIPVAQIIKKEAPAGKIIVSSTPSNTKKKGGMKFWNLMEK